MRCLIDSNVFDAIAAEPDLLELVDRLTSARWLELLAATVSVEQVAATPDEWHRRDLQRVRVLVVPPVDEHDRAVAALLAALRRISGIDDALIAAAAAAQRVPLVTEDRRLREAAAAHLPGLVLWSWAADLRPRVVALGREHPPPPYRRRHMAPRPAAHRPAH
ncbi:MAG TPA: PIN domain-containing protein [Baekduia sp.]|uniref:PIN domain-containing protein n=1 Tax=Baekduia sp. TaxID=2600305 RepID=UPI002C3A8AD1|nr:PIN domain-containing protein [Baekduia sp.]HMJ33485.1 PIN domain-containing protein [Baekduia sp.]